MCGEKAVMIWSQDGRWFQCRDETGRVQVSFLGHIGTAEAVRAWCDSHGIEFQIFARRFGLWSGFVLQFLPRPCSVAQSLFEGAGAFICAGLGLGVSFFAVASWPVRPKDSKQGLPLALGCHSQSPPLVV